MEEVYNGHCNQAGYYRKSIVDLVFVQSLVSDSLVKYCIHVLRKPVRRTYCSVIDGKLQLKNSDINEIKRH